MKRTGLGRAGSATLALLLAACAAPQPVLQRDAHYLKVGEAQAARDTDDCRRLAEPPDRGVQIAGRTLSSMADGAVAGAIGGAVQGIAYGDSGLGAAVGAATGATIGFVVGIASAPPVGPIEQSLVDACLRERGYTVSHWE